MPELTACVFTQNLITKCDCGSCVPEVVEQDPKVEKPWICGYCKTEFVGPCCDFCGGR